MTNSENSIIIETERLIFRHWRESDLQPFHSICSDPQVMQFVGDGRVWSLKQTRGFIELAHRISRKSGFCQWTVIHKADDVLIGFCGLVPAEKGAEIGWRLSPDYWGRGLATEASQAVLQYAFETLGLERVVATVQTGNRASLRVIEKLGMQFERGFLQRGREMLVFVKKAPVQDRTIYQKNQAINRFPQ